MSLSATGRLGLAPAPGALALVQELMNTWPSGGYVPDLLADSASARQWLAAVGVDEGAAAPEQLPAVRALRDELRALAASRTGNAATAATAGAVGAAENAGSDHAGTARAAAADRRVDARLVVSADGAVAFEAAGAGADRLSSEVWLAIALAQQPGRGPDDGQWSRLKVCGNADCGSTFYDRSRNNSGVWHDVKTCGNAANLRAYRERRRSAVH